MKSSIWYVFSLLVLTCMAVPAGCGGGGQLITTHFSVSAQGNAIAGTAFNFTVTALDAANNVVTTYTGTVHFTSTDRHCGLPADSTMVNGTKTFSVTLNSAGSQTITATDTVKASVTGTSSPIMVSPATIATHFSVMGPSNATAGAQFNVTVTALDASNNNVTTYSGTVHFTSTDGQAILPSDDTLTNGTKTFSVTLKTAGNQTITATDTVTTSITGTSNLINVSPAGALQITSGTPPSGTVSVDYDGRQGPKCQEGTGGCICVPMRADLVCHLAEYGFPLTASGGEAPYTWSWAAATGSSLPPGLSVSNAFGGVIGIGGTPTTAGTYNVIVTVTDSASPPAHTSAQYSIMIAPPPPPVINTTNSPSAGVNLPYSFLFTAFKGQPPLTWSETGALPQGLTFSPAGVLSGTPTVTGSFPISVMVRDSASQNATPQNFTINVYLHGFAPTGSMASARANFTATLLSTGKVLVAGGQDLAGNFLATAELYDPSSGTFAPTGSMGAGRSWHTATALGNGKVLLTGGFGEGGNAIASAELYDPASATFSSTGTMGTARTFHVATLLNGGKVLVTGGIDAMRNSLFSTEIYDPSTGIFTASSGMETPRSSHVAIELPTGDVLVAGGADANGNVLATAELYNPNSGAFSATGSMGGARNFQTATLLPSDKVLMAGGINANNQVIATAELYDPSSGTFSPTGNMASARWYHKAILLNDGTVLLVGGVGADGSLTSAELFDLIPGQFTPTGSLQTPRSAQAAALLGNGKALIAGGGNASTNELATAEVYQ